MHYVSKFRCEMLFSGTIRRVASEYKHFVKKRGFIQLFFTLFHLNNEAQTGIGRSYPITDQSEGGDILMTRTLYLQIAEIVRTVINWFTVKGAFRSFFTSGQWEIVAKALLKALKSYIK